MWSRNRPSASAMESRWRSRAAASVRDGGEQAVDGGEAEAGVGDHGSGRDLAGREGDAAAGAQLGEVARVGGDEQVEAEVRVRLAGGDRVRRVDRLGRQLHVRDDRPALLAEAGLVEAGNVEAVEQGGGREHLADRDDTRPAHAGQVEVVEPVDR